ncbi:MAG: AbrB/MazE/SpoVT family DNA-binding domain-containing protein [Methanoregula sp.]|jgi:AbrB family looped-hinge helix DNA binding protein|nr:AbrB/MazE/SpoVT family DNA-binding domain-containing protein [Methanoregula sp.]
MAGLKGKHMFGIVKVGEKGQIVIPAEARKIFDIKPGDSLLMLGDEEQGIAIVKSEPFIQFAEEIFKAKESREEDK